jgi:hypothetical protein
MAPWVARPFASKQCATQPQLRYSFMEVMIRMLRTGQFLRSAFQRSYRVSLLERSAVRPSLVNARPAVLHGPRLKRVLCRDRFRCRGCDKKGDDIAVSVHHIRPDVSQIEGMLTLCTSCQALARGRNLSGDDIPDFLRCLWHCLHHPLPAGSGSIQGKGRRN